MTEDRDVEIEVLEIRGEKRITFSGLDYLELDDEESSNITEKYGDIIIELDNIEEEYSGLLQAWHYGRVFAEWQEKFDEEDEISKDELCDWMAMNIKPNRHQRFYEMYPEKGFDKECSRYNILQLAERANSENAYEEGREAYKRVKESGKKLTEPAIRAWYPSHESVEEIAKSCWEKANSKGTFPKVFETVLLMHDIDIDEVNMEEVKEALKDSDD